MQQQHGSSSDAGESAVNPAAEAEAASAQHTAWLNRTQEERVAARKQRWGGEEEDMEDMEAFLADVREMKAKKAQEEEEETQLEGAQAEAKPKKPPKIKRRCPLCKKDIVPVSFDAHMAFHRNKGETMPENEEDFFIDPTFGGQGVPRVLILMGLPGSGKSTNCLLHVCTAECIRSPGLCADLSPFCPPPSLAPACMHLSLSFPASHGSLRLLSLFPPGRQSWRDESTAVRPSASLAHQMGQMVVQQHSQLPDPSDIPSSPGCNTWGTVHNIRRSAAAPSYNEAPSHRYLSCFSD